MYRLDTEMTTTMGKACHRCGRRLTSFVRNCPACGHRNPYLALSLHAILGLALIAALVGILVWVLLLPVS